MYIAFIDLFWCSARFADHVYHVATLRIPSLVASEVIGFVVHILFGYHQLLSTCLSLYAYARVVKEKPVKLGSFDWKLHVCSLGPSALVAVVFALIGGFGPNAFWSLANARTTSGVAVSFTAFFISLVNALVTTGCRFLISAKLDAALSAIASDVSSTDITTSSYSSSGVSRCEVQIGQVASACIANQTRVASWTYIPLALATYALAMFHAQGYIEPLASLCTTVCANVMGFANAYAYFTNESMKLELRRQVRARSRSRTVRTRS
ncbi:hypothetical protein BCR44DRAFT_1486471 [Catenaria anguillulae PL171]|uniref:G protein-coupled receptor n=1 Tax=Catenaria anguillulae PL171 TaxID=765915 RepID=A0A1Y2HGE0_9FUNG|nr:hypothetical protein BCR44DRAFT_1486471 [Catenaria anguillulae PL171]